MYLGAHDLSLGTGSGPDGGQTRLGPDRQEGDETNEADHRGRVVVDLI